MLGMVDHNPRAKTHLLVIPQQHIPYVDDLTASHHDLRKQTILLHVALRYNWW